MKKNSRIFKDSKHFISDFFQYFKGHTKVHAIEYFKLFQKPLDFSDLLQRCRPSAPPRILLLDGQSRVGKTWTAVGLVRELIELQLADAVWSSGEDSRCIYSEKRETVADAIKWVMDSIKTFIKGESTKSPIRLVILLDDFFGPARLRELSSDERGFQLVKDCLISSGEQNPILKDLLFYKNVEASLIITGRSSIFAAAEIRLNVDLGGRVGRAPRAVFQAVDGTVLGAGASEWLDECLRQHTEFVRKHKEFALPPITAFSNSFPDSEEYASGLPDILFGGDLRAIIRETELTKDTGASFDLVTQARLRRLLLIYVAPALVFPLPSINSCLIGKEENTRAVLSLQPEEHGDFALRVPNRYYLRAIQQELLETDSLVLLADSLITHAQWLKEHGQEMDCDEHMYILSRGLIERGLESVDEALKEQDGDGKQHAEAIRRALSQKVHDLPGAQEEPLLRWEAALVSGLFESSVISDVAEKAPRHPGLASAIGWGLYRFRRDPRIESATLKNICIAFERRAKELGAQEDHMNLTEDQRELIVAYSNFIRWAAQMEAIPAEESPIHFLSEVPATIKTHPQAHEALMMVLEDALIWADSFMLEQNERLFLGNLRPARDLWDALESQCVEPATALNRDASLIANRLFSLEWHNEWKERGGYFQKVLFNWLQSNQKVALDLIEKRPELLDENLAYHWLHMITQWSVWTRDWCFSPDPNAYEYQKEPIGCGKQKNNQGIYTILMQAINSALKHGNPQHRLRNAFFLLGIRSVGLSEGLLLEVHQYLSEVIKQVGSASQSIKGDMVQAIYELIRQGYMDRTMARVSIQQGDERRHRLPKELQIQFGKFLDNYGRDEWESYIEELKRITCLDVLPHGKTDLIPYGYDA